MALRLELAVETYAEFAQLVGNIAFLAGGVAGDIDTDMGAAGAEDSHTPLNVGVGTIFLSTTGVGVVARVDIGVEVFVADGNGDIDVVDIEQRVGIAGQRLFDVRQKAILGQSLGRKTVVVVFVGEDYTGYVDAEGVAILFIVEGDYGLILSAPGQGVPLYFAPAANDKAELMPLDMVGQQKYLLGGVAAGDFLFEEPHHGGGGGGKGVACGGVQHNELENAGCVLHQAVARHTIVQGLHARGEAALRLAATFSIAQFPAVDKLIGGRQAVVVSPFATPGQEMHGDFAFAIVVGIGDGGIVV